MSRRIHGEKSSVRRWLALRLGLALGAVVLCTAVAGTLVARQQAGQRLSDQAATAKAVFDRSLTSRLHRARSASARRRAPAEAAVDAARMTGATVALGTSTGGSARMYRYPLAGGGMLSVSVASSPVASTTRKALIMAVGLGLGAVLLMCSLLLPAIDRRLFAPLRRFADSLKAALAGDEDARADEHGPAELHEAATTFNKLLAKFADQRDRLNAAVASDPLTGATNNPQFHESLGIELKRAQRDGKPVSIVLLDIDGFGSINDANGRSYGDELLQRSAEALRRMMRATDILARIGGDDFALILPGADGQLAVTIADRARNALRTASSDTQEVSASAGVASYPADARDGTSLLQLAGGALRWAKSSGRGQTRRYDPDNVTLPTDEEERAEIEGLLEREQPIVAFFQPLVSLSTGRILGYEALSRFADSPGRGPDSWFAQAARCGLAARLEAAALRAALGAPGRPQGTFLSINVSPTTLGSQEIRSVLPADMSGLVVEITEHELADDLDALEKELVALRERGAKIALDDAGAGYSGLQQVMRIQPDVIKLDRSLVMNVHEDPAKVALIDSFVRFARRTGASVCAEGIESMEELKLLADLDVTYGQGYALARPAPGWATLSASVSESLLRSSLRSQGDMSCKAALPESGDQRLEFVSARLSKVNATEDLYDVVDLIASDVGADAVCLSRWLPAENSVEAIADSSSDEPRGRFNLANYPSTAHVLNTGEAVQVLASDPGADLGELALLGRLGFASLLMVPVVRRDERIGLLEVYGRIERPWTRSEINRARIISYQLGAVLDGLERSRDAGALATTAVGANGHAG